MNTRMIFVRGGDFSKLLCVAGLLMLCGCTLERYDYEMSREPYERPSVVTDDFREDNHVQPCFIVTTMCWEKFRTRKTQDCRSSILMRALNVQGLCCPDMGKATTGITMSGNYGGRFMWTERLMQVHGRRSVRQGGMRYVKAYMLVAECRTKTASGDGEAGCLDGPRAGGGRQHARGMAGEVRE